MRSRFAAKVVGGIALMVLASGCGDKAPSGRQAVRPAVTGVTLEAVSLADLPDFFAATGTVKPVVSSVIAARIAGVVEEVHVREGDRVARGKLLVTLRAEEAVSGAAGAKAAVEEARQGVEEARSRKRLAEETFARHETLFREQAVTRQEFDTKRTELDVATKGLARAEARLIQMAEQSKGAGTLAGYARISAPISGVVTGKAVEKGATVFPGMPLVTVEEEGRYRLEVAAPDALSSQVRLGQALSLAVDGVPGDIGGVVSEVSPVADPVTRTRVVKIDVLAKGLRSGMFGRARIPAGTARSITIPRSAVVERGMLRSVWVADGENAARMRLVKTGDTRGDRIAILSGLSDGERVVTGGIEKVSEGVRLR